MTLMPRQITLHHDLGALQPAQIAWLQATLLDLSRFAAHHPYMDRATRLEPDPGVLAAADPEPCARYTIEETIRFLGVWPHHPRYQVESWLEDDVVRWRSTVQGLLKLELWWSLPSPQTHAPLIERVVLGGPAPVCWAFLKIMVPAHEQAARSLRAALAHEG